MDEEEEEEEVGGPSLYSSAMSLGSIGLSSWYWIGRCAETSCRSILCQSRFTKEQYNKSLKFKEICFL